MTEQEWNSCTDPQMMLEFLKGKVSDRKLRLFTCACCRRIWEQLRDPRSQQAVEISERYAEGRATKKELTQARLAARAASWNATAARARQVSWDGPGRVAWFTTCEAMASAARQAARSALWMACTKRPSGLGGLLQATGWEVGDLSGERCRFAVLLRCIFGNPFYSVTRPPRLLTWRDGTIPKLAQAAYDHRQLPSGHLDPALLTVLADALEEAGCTDGEVLGHLRSPTPHVRGCQVIDLLTGRK